MCLKSFASGAAGAIVVVALVAVSFCFGAKSAKRAGFKHYQEAIIDCTAVVLEGSHMNGQKITAQEALQLCKQELTWHKKAAE